MRKIARKQLVSGSFEEAKIVPLVSSDSGMQHIGITDPISQ
jgi:hypothetical protein